MICKLIVSILRYKNSMTGGENLRINSRNILAEIINDNSITVNLERGIYNYTIWRSLSRHQPCMWDCPHFTNTYKNKLKQVCANLIPNSYVGNKSLITRLKDGEFKPHEVAFGSPCDLFPERWEKIIEEKKKRDAAVSEIDSSIATEQFKCAKCGGNKTTYYTMQTRSSDESETIFITCLGCGRKWRK